MMVCKESCLLQKWVMYVFSIMYYICMEELLQISPKKCIIDDLIFWPLLEALLSVCVSDCGFYLHLLPLVLPQYVNILECPLLREIHHIPTLYHKYSGGCRRKHCTIVHTRRQFTWTFPSLHLVILTPRACLATTASTSTRAMAVHGTVGFWRPILSWRVGLGRSVPCLLELLL